MKIEIQLFFAGFFKDLLSTLYTIKPERIYVDLHLHSLHFDSPRVRSLVQATLHDVWDRFSFGENFRQILRSQYIS